MTTYNKYTWVCTGDCDALIEYTFKDGFGWPNGVMQLTCPCNSTCTLLSVEDATIPYTDTPLTKEEPMETTEHLVPDTYNSNLLVTYKKINGYSNPEYITDKVTSIEWDLHNARQSQKTVSTLQSKIDAVKEIICEAYADSQDQDTLREIAEALGIELIKEVQFTASVEVTGTYSYDVLSDYSEYDLESVVTDSLYAESNDGNITIDDTEVCNVREA
jgi:neutral trehalase